MAKTLKKISDLALFGAAPFFNQPLHVGAPNIGDRQVLLQRINDLLDRRRFTNNGPFVREFEKRLADYLNVKHVIAINNGTIALEIAIRALNLKGEVIVPAMTFVATAHSLQWQQIKPVFCDIDANSYLMDVTQIEKLITPLTTGIIGVHLWARACNVEELQNIAQKYNLKLLFDAAHAFGCTYKGQMIGNFGNVEVFSFHATKFFNTFEGGAVATNDDLLAEKIRLMRNFGFAGKDRVIYIGTNGKMSEIAAAMGLTSFESLDHFIAMNKRNYYLYLQYLRGLNGIKIMEYDNKEQTNYQYIVLRIDERKTKIKRDQLLEILMAENVIARRYFYPGVHRMEPYRSYQPHAGLLLPVTERVVEEVLVLPTGSAIDEQKIAGVCQIISFAIEHAEKITTSLEEHKTKQKMRA